MEEIQTNRWLKQRLSRRNILRAGIVGGTGLWASSVAGCTPNQSPRTDSTSVGSGGTGGRKFLDKVTIAVGDEPPLFDPHRATGGITMYFTTNVYQGLVERDLSGKIVPSLATSWSALPDGKSYEFRLRQGVKFHNEDAFTAQDVEFSFRRQKDPKIQPRQAIYGNMESLEVVDDYTVRFHLKKVDSTFIFNIADGMRMRILPKKYLEQVTDDGFEKAPVGTGPYKFLRRAVKESWELSAFDQYWGGAPSVKQAIFKVIPESVTLAAVLKTGEADFVANYPPLFLEEMAKTPGFKVIKNRTYQTVCAYVNSLRETDPDTGRANPYRDKRLRLALNLAIDKDAIINNILKGMGEKVAVFYPEEIGYDPNLKPYPYDPKRAKELLAEAGYPNGLDATFYGVLGERMPMSKEVGEAVASYLTAIGIRTKVVNEEYAMWLKRIIPGTMELWAMGYAMNFVAGQYHPLGGLKDYAGCGGYWYCNKELDAMISQMFEETDVAKLEQQMRRAAGIVYDEAPVTVLYRNVMAYAMKDSLDFTPKVNGPFVELINLKPKA